MSQFLKQLYRTIKAILHSKYKWLLIFFVVWLYRIEFIPDAGGGLAKVLQVVTTFGMLHMIRKFQPRIYGTVMHSNLPVRSFMWLYMFATLSCVWAYMPTFAGFLGFQNVVLMMAAIWMFTTLPTFESREKAFLFASLGMALFEAVFYRALVHPGLFVHCLATGSTSAMVFSYSAAEYLIDTREAYTNRRKFLRGSMLISLFLLVTSTSSGANASALFGFSIALMLSGKVIYAAILFLAAGVLWVFPDLVEKLIFFIMPGKTKETIESATGRRALWDVIWYLAAQRPWLGWGFGCVERAASDLSGIRAPDAHNIYLGFYGSLGIVGSALAYLHFAASVLTAYKKKMRFGMTGVLCGLCCALLNGYSYGFLTGKACSITVSFIMLVALTFVHGRKTT